MVGVGEKEREAREMRARVKEGDRWTGGRQLNETKQAGRGGGRTHQRGHREIEEWEWQMGML